MKDIDFLPAKYREATAQRKTRAWRVVVMLAFIALLAVAAAGQLGLQGHATRDLDEIRRQYDLAMAQQQQMAALGEALRPHRARAHLLTCLRHPWPTSVILAKAMGPLPESAVITKIAVHRETTSAVAPPAFEQAAEPAEDTRPLAQRDLDQMRKEMAGTSIVVILEGATPEIVDLQAYVGRLASDDLFERAELADVVRQEKGDSETSQFTIRLVVSQGYAHPSALPNLPLASTSDRQPAETTGERLSITAWSPLP